MISGLTPKPKKISSSENESFVITTNKPSFLHSKPDSKQVESNILPFTGNAHINSQNRLPNQVPLKPVHRKIYTIPSTIYSDNFHHSNNRTKIPIREKEVYNQIIQIGPETIHFRDYSYLEQKRLLYLQQLFNSLLDQESQLLFEQSSLTNNSTLMNELKTENKQLLLQENGFNKQYILECVRYIKYSHNNNNHSDSVIGMLLLSKEGYSEKGYQNTLKESQYYF